MIDASCVIPAAGLSSRMGRWKGKLQVREEGRDTSTLLGRTVRTAMKECRDVVVVAGKQIDLVREITDGLDGIVIMENPQPEQGMLSSIQIALSCTRGPFFILPMDMPLIESDHFAALYRNFTLFEGRKVLRPCFQGVPGHPVLLPEHWAVRIARARGKSLKPLLAEAELELIDWPDRSVVFDLDTEEAYREYLQISG